MDYGMGPPGSIEPLIEQARAGDKAALEKLFQWCRPLLEGWATRRLAKKQPGLARPSDIVQETALRAFRGLSTFEGTTELEFLAWLESILRTCTTQMFRDAGRKKRNAADELSLEESEATELPATEPTPSQATAQGEEWRLIFGHMFRLPDEQRTAIWLCHLKELAVAEVAKRMGKTEAAVAGLLRRGLEALRALVAGDDGAQADSARITPAQQDATTALLAYLRRRDAGETLHSPSFIAEYPSCSDELERMLEWVLRIHALRIAHVRE